MAVPEIRLESRNCQSGRSMPASWASNGRGFANKKMVCQEEGTPASWASWPIIWRSSPVAGKEQIHPNWHLLHLLGKSKNVRQSKDYSIHGMLQHLNQAWENNGLISGLTLHQGWSKLKTDWALPVNYGLHHGGSSNSSSHSMPWESSSFP